MTPTSTPNSFSAVVIGGSAGSIDPLKQILAALPTAHKSFAVICVLHLLGRQKSLLPEILGHGCPWSVKDAESTEPVVNGTVYLAPPDYHLSVEKNRTLALSNEEPVMFSRPSIDLLFQSAAPVYKEELLAIILSGANSDGASGLKHVLKKGGSACAQDLSIAEFKEMPKAALSVSPLVQSLTLSQIADILNRRS